MPVAVVRLRLPSLTNMLFRKPKMLIAVALANSDGAYHQGIDIAKGEDTRKINHLRAFL